MKRSAAGPAEVAEWNNLAYAFYLARRGTSARDAAAHFADRLEVNLARLHRELRDGLWQPAPMLRFTVHDPKRRTIHAPVFRDRVVHHAIVTWVGPVLERGLVDDTYACRKGKGPLAAVRRCQHFLRRAPWYVQVDIAQYFASIDHDVLKGLLARRFKHPGMLALLDQVIDHYRAAPGKGLPIGALTSQQFANYYLNGADRLLAADPRVAGMIRYMDDIVWFVSSRRDAHATLCALRDFLEDKLALRIKPSTRIGRSRDGLVFCGYRILGGTLLLTRRRKRRYAQCRARWERAALRGDISMQELQRNFAAILGMTLHADAVAWRREQLARCPVEPALS